MTALPNRVKEIFEAVDTVVFATAAMEFQPNACIVGMKKIIDDETVYLSDQFFKKTLANVLVNPKVSVVFWNERGAYQIHGTARYVNEGPEFEEQAAWANAAFEAGGMHITAKGGCFVHVDEVYSSIAGLTAGGKIE
ncbi:MAG: pyridoxamine 5'-phosphate oxidase family protein [Eggerthellaceae bacterium]|nr:pyridoxamine 5'-phosphate oxidase family protein [Eggerthellaceae bacterium]